MIPHTISEGDDQAAALKANAALAERVSRWMRVRLTAAVLFAVAGVGVVLATQFPLASLPFFLLSIAALFLFFEARDHRQEILRRRWKSITPRVDRVIREADAQDRISEPSRIAG